MRNFLHSGNFLTFTAEDSVASGQGVMQGALFGIATTRAAVGENFEAALTGVFDLPKATGALTKGQKIYWDDSANNVTGTATGNALIGATTEAATTDAPTVAVRLNGVAQA
jgi:predicted RecA/RadA family phage recombinase